MSGCISSRAWGNILLADLTAGHVQAMFTAITRQHDASGHSVTAATLARVRATLRAALNAAIRAGLITVNAASRAEMPTPRRPRPVVWTAARVAEWQRTGTRPPVAVWTPAQTARFLNAIRGHRLYAAYHLIALRGLRRGEAAGLRWCDIDLDTATAIITCQLQQYDGHLILCPPKTACSERAVALDRTTVAVLRLMFRVGYSTHLCVLRHRGRHPLCPRPRCRRAPGWCLVHPAGPEPADEPGGARRPVPVPDP